MDLFKKSFFKHESRKRGYAAISSSHLETQAEFISQGNRGKII